MNLHCPRDCRSIDRRMRRRIVAIEIMWCPSCHPLLECRARRSYWCTMLLLVHHGVHFLLKLSSSSCDWLAKEVGDASCLRDVEVYVIDQLNDCFVLRQDHHSPTYDCSDCLRFSLPFTLTRVLFFFLHFVKSAVKTGQSNECKCLNHIRLCTAIIHSGINSINFPMTLFESLRFCLNKKSEENDKWPLRIEKKCPHSQNAEA